MEDEIIATLLVEGSDIQLFGVFDGHGGRRVVERIVELVPDALRDALAGRETSHAWPRLTAEELTNAVVAVDNHLLTEAAAGGWDDGSTALIVLGNGHGQSLQLAQLGDAQAVLCGALGAEPLCTQHRVGEPAEDQRLEECGTTVDEQGRLVGNGCAVAVTRALGDANVKSGTNGGLTAVPEVSVQRISPADELLIIGCDGLWDVMEADEAWEIAKRAGKKRSGEWDLAAAATALVQGALNRDTGDNCSVLCVGLKKPRAPRGGAQPSQQSGAGTPRSGGTPDRGQPISVMLSASGQVLSVNTRSGAST